MTTRKKDEAPPVDNPERRYWALFSGGKDSITTAHVLHERGQLAGCVFIDTTIKTPDVVPHIKSVCEKFSWPLEIYTTTYPYEKFVRKYGFPGPSAHFLVMNYLKGRGVRQFKKAHPGEFLASGVRTGESRRRLGNAKEWSKFEGVWVYAPILGWTDERVWEYINKNGLPRSPAYKTLHISGDCLCGSFAKKEEAGMIQMFYPGVAQQIEALEAELDASGHKHNRWGRTGLTETRTQKKQTPLSILCAECDILSSEDK